MSDSIDHISFNTFVHEDNQKDFKKVAPTKKETKKNLAQVREEQRCHRCGTIGSEGGLKVCSKCKFSRYCSRECQVADWTEHRKTCRPPRTTDDKDEQRHPDLAMKLALHVPACDYLIHLFQVHALLSMSLLTDIDAANTNMLRISVSTLPSDTMAYMKATMSGQDTSKLQIMLNIDKLEAVPLSLTPAMQLELDERKAKTPSYGTIVPLMFTNGAKQFFHPTALTAAAVEDARKRPPIQMKSTLSDMTELPLNEANLRDVMNMFIRQDKKNQLKLRAMPK